MGDVIGGSELDQWYAAPCVLINHDYLEVVGGLLGSTCLKNQRKQDRKEQALSRCSPPTGGWFLTRALRSVHALRSL
ncbi:MAG: hypothetical protein ABSF73_02805 [Terriglobia bacterium]|jgi:hypothetical protein